MARYAGIYAAELLVAYEIKKPHSWLPCDKIICKLWWAHPAATATIHIKNALTISELNLRRNAPSPIVNCNNFASLEFHGHDTVKRLTDAPFHPAPVVG